MDMKSREANNDSDNIPSDDEWIKKRSQEIEKRRLQHEAEIERRGTTSKELFKRVCETTTERLFTIISDFVLAYQFDLGTLSIQKVAGQLLIVLSDFLPLGHVRGLSINDQLTEVTVVMYSTDNLIDESKELYKQMEQFFIAICQKFDTYWVSPTQMLHPHVNEEMDGQKQEEKVPLKSKRGPRRYSNAEKIKAVQEWDALDRDIYPITLAEWLENKFGTEAGKLLVPESTFYGWRKKINS